MNHVKPLYKRVIVTGGAGFIGSHLVDFLLEKGCEVRVIDNLSTGHLKNLEKASQSPRFQLLERDIREPMTDLFEGVDWVFHLAALADIVPSIEKPREYFETNVQGTLHVLEEAKRAQVSRLIYAASSSCYGIATLYPTPETAPLSPQYPYALTKLLAEQLVLHWAQVYHVPAVSLRLFNVYGLRARTTGSYGAVFGVFLGQKLHGYPYTVVGNGTQTRDFTHVSDVVRAFFQAAEASCVNELYNVGSGGHYSISHLVELLGGDVTYIPKRPGEPECTFADTAKIQRELGWTPRVSFEQGVEEMLAHLSQFSDAPLWKAETIQQATQTWFETLQS